MQMAGGWGENPQPLGAGWERDPRPQRPQGRSEHWDAYYPRMQDGEVEGSLLDRKSANGISERAQGRDAFNTPDMFAHKDMDVSLLFPGGYDQKPKDAQEAMMMQYNQESLRRFWDKEGPSGFLAPIVTRNTNFNVARDAMREQERNVGVAAQLEGIKDPQAFFEDLMVPMQNNLIEVLEADARSTGAGVPRHTVATGETHLQGFGAYLAHGKLGSISREELDELHTTLFTPVSTSDDRQAEHQMKELLRVRDRYRRSNMPPPAFPEGHRTALRHWEHQGQVPRLRELALQVRKSWAA